MDPASLQIFLLVNVFLAGSLATIVVQHAYAHFKQKSSALHPKPASSHKPAPLPANVRKQLLAASQAQYQKVIDQSAAKLARDLDTTEAQLNARLDSFGSGMIDEEITIYREELAKLREQAAQILHDAQAEITEHQTALKATMASEVAEEKQRLIQQIDTKLADAMASFLMENLPHNVDLGAQNAYLLSVLEDHKAEFAREVNDAA